MAARKPATESKQIVIPAPDFQVVQFELVGTSPFVSNAFPHEAREQMRADMAAGEAAKAPKKRKAPKDFDKGCLGSIHFNADPKARWPGIPCSSFRAALIRACSLCGIEMVKAKMIVFIEADGYDEDGNGLVRITGGEPKKFETFVRTPPVTGRPNITARARWDSWGCKLRVKFNREFISAEHVANLVMHAGVSVGVGAGRPMSTSSSGMGWGTFKIRESGDAKKRIKE